MTAKEMATEYRKSLWQRLVDEDEYERLGMFDENVEEAWLAGFEAGRPTAEGGAKEAGKGKVLQDERRRGGRRMTDEKMAEEYCNKLYAGKVKNEDYDEYGRLLYRSKEIREAFLAGLEVGEEKVKEEEAELQQKWLEESFEKSKLIKENAELKENFRICEKNADTYFDNFTKAKGIIKNIIRVTWGEGWNYSLDWKVKAEQFLEEMENESHT